MPPVFFSRYKDYAFCVCAAQHMGKPRTTKCLPRLHNALLQLQGRIEMTDAAVRIALLRGINVGGHRKLPMAELRALLAGIGMEAPQSHIQSGNLAFRSPQPDPDRIAETLAAAIDAARGFRPKILVYSRADFEAILDANPYQVAPEDRRSVHVFFLARPCRDPDRETMTALTGASESWTLTEAALYLHAPDGIGRSKLADRIERCVPVDMTARNLRTVHAVADMAAALD